MSKSCKRHGELYLVVIFLSRILRYGEWNAFMFVAVALYAYRVILDGIINTCTRIDFDKA